MQWHIINHRDYIDGPFDTFEMALQEAYLFGNETRPNPHLRRRTKEFFVYKPAFDRQERWQAEYWICTREGALARGISPEIFEKALLETR